MPFLIKTVSGCSGHFSLVPEDCYQPMERL